MKETEKSSLEPPSRDARAVSRLAALIEIGVVIGLSFAIVIMAQPLIQPGLAAALGLVDDSGPDMLAASWAMAQQLAYQYLPVVVLVAALAFLRGRKSRASYGLTRAKQPLGRLVLIGAVAGLAGTALLQPIFLADQFMDVGDMPVMRQIMADSAWDWRFWLFMAVASFAIVPFLEEFTWRGYALGRMTEAWTPGAALVAISVMFALVHSQYTSVPSLLNLGLLIGVVVLTFVLGLITLRTGSLIPAIVAHMIANLPYNLIMGAVIGLLTVLALIVFRRQICDYIVYGIRLCLNVQALIALLALAALGALAVAAQMVPYGLGVLAGLALAAFIVFSVTIKSPWRQTGAETGVDGTRRED